MTDAEKNASNGGKMERFAKKGTFVKVYTNNGNQYFFGQLNHVSSVRQTVLLKIKNSTMKNLLKGHSKKIRTLAIIACLALFAACSEQDDIVVPSDINADELVNDEQQAQEKQIKDSSGSEDECIDC